uniref:Uncharacterized protein n=1 Tax=Physcomitrium patens TaxID=3218 RepID=A0A2K1K461_PHYPA|nr:hypothetical protein PHYPA_013034 [Physcomitrium patens]
MASSGPPASLCTFLPSLLAPFLLLLFLLVVAQLLHSHLRFSLPFHVKSCPRFTLLLYHITPPPLSPLQSSPPHGY